MGNGRNKKKKKIGKPFALLYYPAIFFVSLFYRIKYGIRINRSGLKGIKGPAIVLAPHLSGKDHILTAMTLFPYRPTYVLSMHFYGNKRLRGVLKLMHTIPKRMFCSDGSAVLSMIRASREGNIVVLFPEGRLTWYGRSLRVADGTAELVKQIGADVYTITSNGAGMIWPKWAKYTRRGKISITTEHILKAEEIRCMSVDEVRKCVEGAILHDEEKAMPGVGYRAADLTAGLDGIIWKCPSCGAEKHLVCRDSRIKCTECGLDDILDEYGRISGASNEYGIFTVADWYEYCASAVRTDEPLSSECTVSAADEDNYIVKNAGKGRITLTKDSFRFEGEVFDRELSFENSTSVMTAFPITVSDHIDAYYQNKLYCFRIEPDPRDAIKYVAFLDNVTSSRKDHTK